jgi:hypothetical protein
MTTKSRLLFCLLIAAGLLMLGLRVAFSGSPPAAGKVLILENERTLEGDIERVGDQYRVRRSVGETWVPGDKVLQLCASLEEGYQFLRSRANLQDPDERLRLAQWCHLHGLGQQALDEVNAAVELRPDHAPTRRLLAHLQQLAANPSAAPAGTSPAPDKEAETPLPAIDINSESMCVFSTKVQPILMNACASCHASGRGGAFKLLRSFDANGPSRKILQQNAAAVLTQINLDRPQGSPLLTKAVTAHGTLAQAPLKGHQAPAYRVLEDWVRQTVESNPHLQGAHAAAPAGPPAAPVPPQFAQEQRPASEPAPAGTGAAPPQGTPVSTPQSATPAAPAASQAPAGPADPFDPIIFNRQMHPERK